MYINVLVKFAAITSGDDMSNRVRASECNHNECRSMLDEFMLPGLAGALAVSLLFAGLVHPAAMVATVPLMIAYWGFCIALVRCRRSLTDHVTDREELTL